MRKYLGSIGFHVAWLAVLSQGAERMQNGKQDLARRNSCKVLLFCKSCLGRNNVIEE